MEETKEADNLLKRSRVGGSPIKRAANSELEGYSAGRIKREEPRTLSYGRVFKGVTGRGIQVGHQLSGELGP